MRVGYDPKHGRIKTSAKQAIDRAFLAHYQIAAADATGESDTAVLILTTLGEGAQTIEENINHPKVPRNVKVKASTAITTNVKVYGTDFAGEEISEQIALTGTAAAPGNLAFRTITKIDLPARTNTPAKQKATVTVTQGAQAAGITIFTFVSAATGTGYDISVEFAAEDDTVAEAAAVLAAALNSDETFKAKWKAETSSADILIERLEYASQDSTINLTVKTAGDSAITLDAIAANTVSGVAEDKVSVGIGKKFGIPYMLEADEQVIVKLFGKSVDAGTVTENEDELAKNVFAPSGTPDEGNAIDLYIIV